MEKNELDDLRGQVVTIFMRDRIRHHGIIKKIGEMWIWMDERLPNEKQSPNRVWKKIRLSISQVSEISIDGEDEKERTIKNDEHS